MVAAAVVVAAEWAGKLNVRHMRLFAAEPKRSAESRGARVHRALRPRKRPTPQQLTDRVVWSSSALWPLQKRALVASVLDHTFEIFVGKASV